MSHHSHTLTTRQLCDLELILNTGFAPLHGFLTEEDYKTVVEQYRLSNLALWPIPVVLDLSQDAAEKIAHHDHIDLRNEEGHIMASMLVESIWQADKIWEAEHVYGTVDPLHPGVQYLFEKTQAVYIGGRVTLAHEPNHVDFPHLRKTPDELKKLFKAQNLSRIVGFQTRNPMHRAHQELTFRAARDLDAHLLLHPSVGQTKPGDIDSYTRIKCYQSLLKYYPPNSVTLSLLPLAMRMAGPREALWHALIRKNYGCTHFIIGRDHAGPGKNQAGENYYEPYAAQEFALNLQAELGITIVPFEEMHYVKTKKHFLSTSEIANDPTIAKTDIASISGSQLRHLLKTQGQIPDWFSYPEVLDELRKSVTPRHKQGLTIFFTGLPSAGKSTLAKALQHKLMEITNRTISLLDGDLFRQLFSKNLGFSKQDRDENVKRVSYIAAEVTKHRGIALCALIAPYEDARQFARNMVEQQGNFVEIYVATPLAECEKRDPKGLYKKARLREVQHFSGIDDPYEAPRNPDIIIDTQNCSVVKCVDTIIQALTSSGFLSKETN